MQRVAIVLGLVMGLMVGSLWGQTDSTTGQEYRDSTGIPVAISYEELTSYAGVTLCWKGRAFSYISTSLDSMETAEVRAHEAKHVEQMQRFGSCAKFSEWYATPAGMMDAETEAYAAGLCRWVELGGDGISRRRSIKELLEKKFGPANMLTAIQKVEQHAKGCGLSNLVTP